MLPSADEDNDDVIESFWLYIFSVFPSFVYYYLNVIVILNMYALKVYNVHIDSVYCAHCTIYIVHCIHDSI